LPPLRCCRCQARPSGSTSTFRQIFLDGRQVDIEVVIDDPKAYTKPLRYTQRQDLQADTELIEYVCAENVTSIRNRVQ
jgi:hypothetical protein